jgi:hypothetical protein
VDINDRFVRDENGEIVFSFGKHQGKSARTGPSYQKWMIRGITSNFLTPKRIVIVVLLAISKEFDLVVYITDIF